MNTIDLATFSDQELFDLGMAIFFRKEEGVRASVVTGYFTKDGNQGFVSADFGELIPMNEFTHAITMAEFNAVLIG